MADNTQNLIENLLKSVDIVVNNRLQGLQFDKTITCSILSNKYASHGEYTVTDGTTTFKAYTEVTTYQVGQYVYVKIPNGSFNNKKLITGRYIEDNSEYYTYVPPMDSYIDISHNLIQQENEQFGLTANGKQKETVIWHVHDRNYSDYDRIGLRAGFMAWLGQYDLVKGTYGLRLYIKSKKDGKGEIVSVCTLDTSDFYGSLYNYETFYNQEKVFDIEDLGVITDLILTFFQDNDFEDAKGNRISGMIDVENEVPNNIFMSSPYVSIGYNLNKFNSDTVLLYTLDSAKYKAVLSDEDKANLIAALDPDDEDYNTKRNNILYDAKTAQDCLNDMNKRELQMRWIHFDEDMNVKAFEENTDLPSTALVHWYKYQLEEGLEDSLAGAFWKKTMPPDKNYFDFKYFKPDMMKQHEMLKVIIENPSRDVVAKKIYNASLKTGTKQDIENGTTISVGDLLYSYLPSEKKPDDIGYYDFIEQAKDNLNKAIQEQEHLLEDYEAQADRVDELYTKQEARIKEYKAKYPNKTEEELLDDTGYKAIIDYFSDEVTNLETRTQTRYDELMAISNEVATYESEIQYYESKVLELVNETEVVDSSSVDLISGLDIQCDADGYNGVYRIYDDNGDIMSSSESVKKRTLTATYQSIVTGDKTLDTAEKIYWYFPITNTMIQYPTEETEFSYYSKVSLTAKDYNAALYKDKYFIKDLSGTYKPATSEFSNTQTYYERSTTTTSKTSDGNYFVICRMGVSIDSEAGTAESKNDSQIFRIKSYYSQSMVNNTIKCVIEKNGKTFEKDISLIFGPTGINGTTYTLSLEFDNKQPAVTVASKNSSDAFDKVKVIPHLYDYQNNDITATYAAAGRISYSWYSEGNEGIGITDVDESDGSVELMSLSTNIEDYKYYILQCTVTNAAEIAPDTKTSLTAFLPIPVRSSEIYTAFDGATKIVYDASGGNPKFYKDGYQIYKFNSASGNNEVIKTAKWYMSLGDDTVGMKLSSNNSTTSVIDQYYPTVTTVGVLSAPAMFIKENGKQVGVECKIDNAVVWFQPLYIYQNAYSSSLLNSWDGSLTTDEKNGTILSTMVGAGTKDSFNRFNGVLMGDISAAGGSRKVGLFGYHQGVQSYGLNIDGTAFIGKSGKGQIKFNGNSGYIQNGSYGKTDAGGMRIDLNEGSIKIIGEKFLQAVIKANGKVYSNIVDAYDAQKSYYNDIKTNLTNASKSCQNEVKALASKKTEYNNDADGYKTRVTDTQSAINTLKSEISILDGTTSKSIKYVQNAIVTTQKNIATKKQELATAQKAKMSSSDKMKKIREIKNQITDLESTLSGQKSTLQQMKTNRANYVAEQTTKNKELKTYQQRVQFYTTRVKELDEKIAALNAKIQVYDKQIITYTNLISGVKGKDGVTSDGIEEIQRRYKEADNADTKKSLENYMTNYLRENLPDSFQVDTKKTGSQILISSLSPYMRVISTSGKTLFHIADDNYYLQTNDYQAHVYDSKTDTFTTVGQGMKINLQTGKIVSYNFDLLAYDSEGNNAGSYVRIAKSGSPYFRVHFVDKTKNRNLNLLELTKTAFVLQSHNWISGSDGVQLDLTNGKITAYNNFNLKATISDDDTYTGSYVQVSSSGNPFFRIHLVDAVKKYNLNLIDIGIKNWIMRSQDWNNDNKTGVCFDMANGKITAYSFNIRASKVIDGITNSIIIDSTQPTWPLQVGKLFKVSWDGKITANHITADGGKIGPFTINSTALYSGTSSSLGNGSGVYLGSSGLSVNDKLIVRQNPTNSYTMTVNGTSYFGGSMQVDGSLNVGKNGSITADGNITSNGTLTTKGSLVVESGGSFGGSVTVTGDLSVTGTIHDSKNNWSSSGNGGSQQLYGTSGNIGNWGINNGAISNDKTSLGSDGVVTIGTIVIDGSQQTNNGDIRFGGAKSNTRVWGGESTLYLYGGSSGVQINANNDSTNDWVITLAKNTKVSGKFYVSGDVSTAGKVIIGGKEIKALAFADDIKKKFSLSYVNFDIWYKVSTPNLSEGSEWGYNKAFPYSTLVRKRTLYTPVYGTNISFGTATEYQPPEGTAWFSRGEYEYETNYVYVNVDTPSVDIIGTSSSGYTKKTIALSKTGNKTVTFEPSSDGSVDRITLSNIDF